MAHNDMTFGYHPVGTHPMSTQTGGGETQLECSTTLQGCVNDDLMADGLRKGWQFQVSTWNVDSLTGRAGEVVEALSDRS